jgi:hypothetical protein
MSPAKRADIMGCCPSKNTGINKRRKLAGRGGLDITQPTTATATTAVMAATMEAEVEGMNREVAVENVEGGNVVEKIVLEEADGSLHFSCDKSIPWGNTTCSYMYILKTKMKCRHFLIKAKRK